MKNLLILFFLAFCISGYSQVQRFHKDQMPVGVFDADSTIVDPITGLGGVADVQTALETLRSQLTAVSAGNADGVLEGITYDTASNSLVFGIALPGLDITYNLDSIFGVNGGGGSIDSFEIVGDSLLISLEGDDVLPLAVYLGGGTDNQNLINGGKTGNNQTINIESGTGFIFSVADADSSITNEIQALSLSNDSLFLASGGFVLLGPYLDNTDDQTINLIELTGADSLRISLEGDGEVPQAVYLGGYISSDNQTIDQFSISGDTLFASLESDAEAAKFIELSPYLDNTDTQLTQEQVEDFSGTMVANGTGTHTGITITYQDVTGDMDLDVDHDAATNFLADEHIGHSTISVIAGDALSGGGTIDGNVTLNLDIDEFVLQAPDLADLLVYQDVTDDGVHHMTLTQLQTLIDTDTDVTTVTDQVNGLDIAEAADDITVALDLEELGSETPVLADEFVFNDMTDGLEKIATLTALQTAINTDVSGIDDIVEDVTPQLGGQLDVNGNSIGDGTLEILIFSETVSAVNEITITNSATGAGPTIASTGDDATIELNIGTAGVADVNVLDNLDVTGNIVVSGSVDGIADLNTDVTANTAKVTNVTTNLTIGTHNATSMEIASSDGTNATAPLATSAGGTNLAGLLSPTQFDNVALNDAKVTNANHTGDATGATALTIATDAVTYAKMQNVVADERLLGNIDGVGGIVAELTPEQVRVMLGLDEKDLGIMGWGDATVVAVENSPVVYKAGPEYDNVTIRELSWSTNSFGTSVDIQILLNGVVLTNFEAGADDTYQIITANSSFNMVDLALADGDRLQFKCTAFVGDTTGLTFTLEGDYDSP
jgi:hypothetical protein